MGGALSTQATATVSIDAYIAELGEFSYINDLGRARFLKTVKALHQEGEAVVKILIKPQFSFDLEPYKKTVLRYQTELDGIPNAIGFSRVVETDRAAYLIRQHIKHNLYDRISTRPFLENIEKLWIAFQLLRALKDAHSVGVFHGDIKSENVLVSSWKWTYLADWAPYKPVTLPETDSADFLFYFNTSGRRSCYVAPERFTTEKLELDASMDIYSLGCVIAELLMEGTSLFSLADAFRYKRGEIEPPLVGIEGPAKEMILSMISIDQSERKSASDYLDLYKDRLFPSYFWDLYDLLVPFAHAPNTKSDAMIEHIYSKFSVIDSILELNIPNGAVPDTSAYPVVVSLPGKCWIPQKRITDLKEGALIPLAFVCSNVAATETAYWRQRCFDLMLALSEFLNDDIKLNRTLPYIVSLLKDEDYTVQEMAVRSITQLLAITSQLVDLNEKVFSEYLFPRLRAAIFPAKPRTKAVYAACLPHIAEFAYTLKPTDSQSPVEPFDDAIPMLVETHARTLLAEKSSWVRRSVLRNFPVMCTRLGRRKTTDILLSHTVTYLNDKDTMVRIDLFRFIAQISPLIGPASLERYVLPLMMQSIVDLREDVVSAVIGSLASVVGLGLVRHRALWDILSQLCKFAIHPNVYIRTQLFLFFSAAAKWIAPAQKFCLLKPIISPVMQGEITDFTDHRSYISAVKAPIALAVYSLTLNWASQATLPQSKSLFWKETDNQDRYSVNFSPDDKRWLERLREVGFNNEDLWQLLLYRDYLRQLAALKVDNNQLNSQLFDTKALPHTWTGNETPTGLEKYISQKILQLDSSSHEQSDVDELTSKLDNLKFSGKPAEKFTKNQELMPQGILVASIKAHRGAVTSLAVCSNQRFFVTGADDCLLKIWDVRSISKGSPRPAISYECSSRVKSLAFLSNRTSFVAGTVDGQITFFDIMFDMREVGITYSHIKVLKSEKLEKGYATKLHQVGDSIYVLTSDCSINTYNLVTGEKNHWQNPVEHGPPTCWCFDRQSNWMAWGTSHGVINLWDLRFSFLVSSWGIGSLNPITALSLHPRASSTWICVGGGFDREYISCWDIQDSECREMLIPVFDESNEPLPSLSPITGKELDKRLARRSLSESFGAKSSVTALYTHGNPVGTNQYIISGSTDRMIRFSDLLAPQKCRVISGLNRDHPGMLYTNKTGSNVKLVVEKVGAIKKQTRQFRLSVIQSEEADIGKNHRGTPTQVQALAQKFVVSVDEVGYMKIYL